MKNSSAKNIIESAIVHQWALLDGPFLNYVVVQTLSFDQPRKGTPIMRTFGGKSHSHWQIWGLLVARKGSTRSWLRVCFKLGWQPIPVSRVWVLATQSNFHYGLEFSTFTKHASRFSVLLAMYQVMILSMTVMTRIQLLSSLPCSQSGYRHQQWRQAIC